MKSTYLRSSSFCCSVAVVVDPLYNAVSSSRTVGWDSEIWWFNTRLHSLKRWQDLMAWNFLRDRFICTTFDSNNWVMIEKDSRMADSWHSTFPENILTVILSVSSSVGLGAGTSASARRTNRRDGAATPQRRRLLALSSMNDILLQFQWNIQ